MALGSVAVSGGMSKKEKERMMYMDGKLVWSAAMGTSGGLSATAPDTVDYIVVRPMAMTTPSSGSAYAQPKDARVARGGTGNVAWYQTSGSYSNARSGYSYGQIAFDASGKITLYYPWDSNNEYLTVEGYHYY
ncbi:MAG: hypothetical protein JNG54_03890 [Faecalibacterium prausnitzii]|nr:hypothetical protein [Faecalibacterium prausnitzii]